MKTLISLIVVFSLSFAVNGQCGYPKSTYWNLTESLGNSDLKRGFAVVVHFPHTDYIQTKINVKRVNQSKCNSRSDKSYYYYFDLENEMMFLYDCFGFVKSYELKKIKQKNNNISITIDEGGTRKITFKITFGEQAVFSEVIYNKHKKYSEIFYSEKCSYYSKPMD